MTLNIIQFPSVLRRQPQHGGSLFNAIHEGMRPGQAEVERNDYFAEVVTFEEYFGDAFDFWGIVTDFDGNDIGRYYHGQAYVDAKIIGNDPTPCNPSPKVVLLHERLEEVRQEQRGVYLDIAA